MNDLLLYERKCYQLGFPLVVGVDEAGRGPLAGPLVVAGVLFHYGFFIEGVTDSKKISAKKRQKLEIIIKNEALAYAVEIIPLEVIKQKNIYQASKWGMIQCFTKIQKKIEVQALLTDAMRISEKELPKVYVESIIKGDQKSFHIAAASILAKMERDRIMETLHEEYPIYNWCKNKGYPTLEHKNAIKNYGISPYHRTNFKLF
ncbi:RNase HII [Brevinema andersonii]|uniref:Ribonuclease n=1 Tax=Brevinema andersonii TaxID=34097 RepID=A0A1I1D2E9_BREAD|nr:ribonuclease HII [Brevinema andersonii]SFB67278.1 RNase HII [Brevinema andersonii]